MTIRIYNTLSRCKEPLQTVGDGKVGMYLCGPTVYKPSHIGHMVGPVIFDAIKRYLVYNGYQVTWVVNITDVDDKLIAEAERRHLPMADVAAEMTEDYIGNLQALGVDSIDVMPKATEHMPEMIAFIESLIDKGYAYNAHGDVYFEVDKYPEYGKLSRRSVDELQGEGGQSADQKRHANDFALWKRAKPGEPSWDSPWGAGRPGWHIECSAMSHKLLGDTFDIHGGGLDLIFPHHENEIAQSECCHGKPMARFWMHNGLMQASGESGKVGGRATRAVDQPHAAAAKISKSTGARPFRELLAEHAPETIRFFLLTTHYRRPIDFSDERLREVHAGLDTFYRLFKRYQRVTGQSIYDLPTPRLRSEGEQAAGDDPLLGEVAQRREAFLDAMDDDFNTGAAIGDLFELARLLNRFCDSAGLEDPDHRDDAARDRLRRAATTLRELGATLGLFQSPPQADSSASDDLLAGLMNLLVGIRQAAREKKDFATADHIRDTLGGLGITLEDRPGGTEWSLD